MKAQRAITPIRGGFVPEYKAIIDYAISQGYVLPTKQQQFLQNQLVKRGLTNGWWAEHDVFYCRLNNGSEDFSLINWIDPGNYTSTLGGDAAWTSNSGIKGTINGVINNNWDNSINNVKYTLNDCVQWVFVKPTNNTTFNALFYQTNNPSISNTQMYLDSGGSSYSRFNFSSSTSEQDFAYTATDYFYALKRNNSANYDIINGSNTSNKSISSTSLSGSDFTEMYLGTLYANIPFYFSGASSSQYNIANLRNDVTWYCQQIGVI